MRADLFWLTLESYVPYTFCVNSVMRRANSFVMDTGYKEPSNIIDFNSKYSSNFIVENLREITFLFEKLDLVRGLR